MAAHEADEAGISDNGDVGGNHPRTLQLLRCKWEFPRNTEFLEVSEILHLPYAEQTSPEALHEIRQVSAYLELLRKRAALDEGYLELATEGCLKSRMRENCTSGSVRGSRQAFHKEITLKGVSRLSTRPRDTALIAHSCGNEVGHDADGSDFPECFCEVETLL